MRRGLLDWSDLQEVYVRCGGTEKTAQHYGVSRGAVRGEMRRQGIPPRAKGSHDWPPEVRRRNADAQRGKTLSPEHRAKVSASLRRTLALPEMREQRRQALLQRFAHMGGHLSPLEQILQNALLNYGISFVVHQPMLGRYVADVALTAMPVIVEADGAYHALPRGRERDKRRDADFQAAGYRVYRFTGAELSRDAYGCIERMAQELGLHSEPHPHMRDDRTPLLVHCDHCGADLWRTPRRLAKSRRVFCSHKCQGAFWRENPDQTPWVTAMHAGRARQRETMRQSDLHGDVQSQAETT